MNVAETLAAMPTEALIDLIRRGLHDDEQTAREAEFWCHGGRWSVLHRGDIQVERAGVIGTDSPSVLGRHMARHDPARALADVDSRRRILVRCEEELLSGIPRVVHFAQETLRDMARPYLSQEAP